MPEPIRVDLAYPRVDGNPTEIIVELLDVRAANAIAISYDFARDGWSISSDMSDPDHPETPPPMPSEVAFVPAWPQADDAPQPTAAPVVDTRHSLCVQRYPDAGDGRYDPRCCRFPKPCSAGTNQQDRSA